MKLFLVSEHDGHHLQQVHGFVTATVAAYRRDPVAFEAWVNAGCPDVSKDQLQQQAKGETGA